MTEIEFVKKMKAIDPSKKCLEFLASRVLQENYRGMQLSQHNRYDVEKAIICLEEMQKIAGKNLMTIRNTDLSKRPSNTPDEADYAKLVDEINKRMGRCTQDSLRKNLFVDFHRMGLINRYNKKREFLSSGESGNVRFVSLTDLGASLVENQGDTFKRNFIWTKAIDNLTRGLANELLQILTEAGKKSISIWEFMLFISFMNCKIGSHVFSRGEVASFADEFSRMSKFQQKAAVDLLAAYCEPDNFSGDKTEKRDFHNWKNEAQQIFMLMNQTVLFEQIGENLAIRVGKNAIFENSAKLQRSEKAKSDYFKNHELQKKIGFELHHVIPLFLAKSRDEFSALDVWENLIYIDAYTHSKISQSGNKNIRLDFCGLDAVLKSPADLTAEILCKWRENLEYAPKNRRIMKTFNEKTLNGVTVHHCC